MRKWILAICICVLALSMTGCSSSFEPSVTSMYVQKNGKITYAVVESFEKEYYSLDEFRTMIDREVEACNSQYSEPAIAIEKLEVEGETLYLLMEFANAEAYSNYSEEYCSVSTIGEALDDNKSFDMVFHDKDYTEYTTADVTEKKDDNVLIVQSEGIVELERKIKYVSNNVEVISEHSAQIMPIEAEDEYAYIIY